MTLLNPKTQMMTQGKMKKNNMNIKDQQKKSTTVLDEIKKESKNAILSADLFEKNTE